MRRLSRKKALKVVKDLDAFSKVPEDYQKTSVRGGSFSLFTFALISFLVVSEFLYYSTTVYKYEYAVDSDIQTKLYINVDITVAMPCDAIGADVLDLAGETTHSEDSLKSEKAVFALTPAQLSWLEAKRSVMEKISEYRSLNDLMTLKSPPMPASNPAGMKLDSCRLYGTLTVSKVAGNFHITIGKHVKDPLHRGAHRHMGSMVPAELYNLSHRIDHLSFGVRTPGMLNPLDATLQVTETRNYVYQYFIQVVPSEYVTFWSRVKTNQYSMTERHRPVIVTKGSAGIPGIFFKYDLSPLKLKIEVGRRPLWKFLIRLCGIVGGIFATSGMIHTFIELINDYIRSLRKGEKKSTQPAPAYQQQAPTQHQQAPSQQQQAPTQHQQQSAVPPQQQQSQTYSQAESQAYGMAVGGSESVMAQQGSSQVESNTAAFAPEMESQVHMHSNSVFNSDAQLQN